LSGISKGWKGEVTAEGLSAPIKRPGNSAMIMLMNEEKVHRKTVQGKPCEGKLHARFEEGMPETERWTA
jgi:hypothetical protein